MHYTRCVCATQFNEAREIRTPNLLIWSQTRCRCAIAPMGIIRLESCRRQNLRSTYQSKMRATLSGTRFAQAHCFDWICFHSGAITSRCEISMRKHTRPGRTQSENILDLGCLSNMKTIGFKPWVASVYSYAMKQCFCQSEGLCRCLSVLRALRNHGVRVIAGKHDQRERRG